MYGGRRRRRKKTTDLLNEMDDRLRGNLNKLLLIFSNEPPEIFDYVTFSPKLYPSNIFVLTKKKKI